MRYWPFILSLILPPLAAQADILHLRNGSRHSGTLLERNDRYVVFRIELFGGQSRIVKRFRADEVVSIERGTLPATASPGPPADAPDGSRDFEQMLREAIELRGDGDHPAALRALQRIATRAGADERARVAQRCRELAGSSLAELLAQTRLTVAEAAGGFHVRFVTPFEAERFGQLVARRQAALLSTGFSGRSLREWLADPAAYEELRPDARQLADAAARVAGMISARLEHDPAIADDRAARAELAALRPKLVRLAGHLRGLPGFTDLPVPGAAEQDAPVATTQPHSAAGKNVPILTDQPAEPSTSKEHHEQ